MPQQGLLILWDLHHAPYAHVARELYQNSDLVTWILLDLPHSYICAERCLLLFWLIGCFPCMDLRSILASCPPGRPHIHVVWPCLQLLIASPQSWDTFSPCSGLQTDQPCLRMVGWCLLARRLLMWGSPSALACLASWSSPRKYCQSSTF